jgi:hypothetical protein
MTVKLFDHHRPTRSVRAIVGPIIFLVGAIVALLLAGRLLVNQFPVAIDVASSGTSLIVTADGSSSQVELGRQFNAIRPVAPIAYRREYQIDGSDSTNTFTFRPTYFAEFGSNPYYRFQALLREEWRYSVWRNLTIADATGQVVHHEVAPVDEVAIPLPPDFHLIVELERPETSRSFELLDGNGKSVALEVNRNDKYIRLTERRGVSRVELLHQYFPRDWRPPLATLTDLLIRAVSLALGLVLLAGMLAVLVPAWRRQERGDGFWVLGYGGEALTSRPPTPITQHPKPSVGVGPPRTAPLAYRVAIALGLVMVLAGSLLTTVVLFHRSPHILDALAYSFQAQMFASGNLWAPPPPLKEAFPNPFMVLLGGRWFAQYPPGTAATLALGSIASVPWLVEPLLATATVLLVVDATRRQYDRSTALLTLLLLATSPFLLLVAGAFLSHVPALFFGTLALYGATRYADRPALRWMVLMALGLGLAFLTREIVAAFYGVTVVLTGLFRGLDRRGRAIVLDVLVGGLIVAGAFGLYLGYNAVMTGSPFLLPRLLFDGRDVYGFGVGLGFYQEHTVAAGLVNAEEQLTSLTFYLNGWPFAISLGLPLLPFLLRRWRGWDTTHAMLAGLFIVGYVGYYYHGIVLGPRYYFEALPSLVILEARGIIVLAEAVAGWIAALGLARPEVRARVATGAILVALLACNGLYYVPREGTLYAGFTGLPPGVPRLGNVVAEGLPGRVPTLDHALVVTDEWWYYMAYLASLNCPTLDCKTVFAYGADTTTRRELQRAFSDRTWYDLKNEDGWLNAVPGAP